MTIWSITFYLNKPAQVKRLLDSFPDADAIKKEPHSRLLQSNSSRGLQQALQQSLIFFFIYMSDQAVKPADLMAVFI